MIMIEGTVMGPLYSRWSGVTPTVRYSVGKMRIFTLVVPILMLQGCSSELPRAVQTTENTLQSVDKADALTLSAGDYKVVLKTQFVETKQELSGYWGVAKDKSLIIANARLFYRGEECRFPRSAYADLANMREPSLATTATGCELRLRGGDASEAYACILTFKDGNLVKRVVRWNIKPESDYEITEYHQSNDPFEMD